jgi:hypothetical protein
MLETLGALGWTRKFSLSGNRGASRHYGLKLLDTLEETKKYIGDIVSFKIENILYYIYFKLKSLGSMVGRTSGVIKKTQFFF